MLKRRRGWNSELELWLLDGSGAVDMCLRRLESARARYGGLSHEHERAEEGKRLTGGSRRENSRLASFFLVAPHPRTPQGR